MRRKAMRQAGMALAMAWCAMAAGGAGEAEAPARLRALCTVFPVYQFVRNVARDVPGVAVERMLPPSLGCPHDYSLTPQDLQRIAKADVIVLNGLGLEEFAGEPIRRANARAVVIDASLGCDALADAEIPAGGPGREGNEEAKGEHRHGGANPHLFSSPRSAAQQVRAIGEGLAKADPANAGRYRKNADLYASRLQRLADDFAAAAKAFPNRKIVTMHEAFDYLARDAGLEIVAVLEESAGKEPAAAEMLALVKRIKAVGAAAVFTEPQYSARIGQTIAKEAGVALATLDPVASGPADAPLDYYERAMEKNLETLKRVLGK
jgi:zinc transport system substrate-binding protein